jgi:hypothetical protein
VVGGLGRSLLECRFDIVCGVGALARGTKIYRAMCGAAAERGRRGPGFRFVRRSVGSRARRVTLLEVGSLAANSQKSVSWYIL